MKKCALSFALFAASLGAAASVSVAVQDQSGFKDALQLGDAGKLEQLLDGTSDDKLKPLLRAGLLRIGGNLPDSSRQARQCYEPEQVAALGSRSMFCGLLLAGNALADGDVAAWASISQDIKTRTEPMYKDYLSVALQQDAARQSVGFDQAKTHYVIDLFSMVDDYAPFKRWPYKTAVARTHKSPDAIALVWHGEVVQGRSSRLPFVQATINGQPIEVLVDTGTNDNFLLGEADARRLGIERITPGWQEVVHLGGAREPSSLGNARAVQIGDSTLRNVPVVVAGNHPAIMGLNLLRQLGAVSLSAKAMVVAPPEAAACKTPMTMSSLIAGGHETLLYPIQVHAAPVQAVLDTGAPMLVYEMRDAVPAGNAASAPTTARQDPPAGLPDIPYASARGDFSIAGKQHRNIGYPIFQRYGIFNFALGAWLLRDHDIVMDFERGHLCITPRDAAPSDAAKTSPSP